MRQHATQPLVYDHHRIGQARSTHALPERDIRPLILNSIKMLICAVKNIPRMSQRLAEFRASRYNSAGLERIE